MKSELVKERVDILLNEADSIFLANRPLSKRYVALARKVAMRARYRLPKSTKRSICKGCNSLQKPGVSCSIRQDSSRREIIYKCLDCGKLKKYKY